MITGYAPIKLKIRIDVKNSMIHRYFFASERIFILRLLRLHILKQYCSVSHLFQVATLMEAKTFNQNVWSPHKIWKDVTLCGALMNYICNCNYTNYICNCRYTAIDNRKEWNSTELHSPVAASLCHFDKYFHGNWPGELLSLPDYMKKN